MKEPLISIVTIAYNSELTIERTIKSVLSQSYKNYEYIIVDGASKDGTLDIVKKYEPLFEGRLKWKSEPDNGIYNAMNKGIERSTGEYIGIVNSDDWLDDNALNNISEEIKKIGNNDALICGSLCFHYENGEVLQMIADKERFYNGIPHYSYNRGLFHPAVFVGRKVYEDVGVFDENFRVMADVDFIYRCYEAKRTFCFIESVISNMSDSGVSNKVNISRSISENNYFLKKRNISGVRRVKLLYARGAQLLIKKLLPLKLIRLFRKINSVSK